MLRCGNRTLFYLRCLIFVDLCMEDKNLLELGVNIDHIATLRNARGDFFPSLVVAAGIVEQNGGDFITVHLREDRRHIRDEDIVVLNNNITTYLNLEMACNEDVLDKALKVIPYKATLVPERRDEVTTEGGLNVKSNFDKIKEYTEQLQKSGIKVSLFIEPDLKELDNYLKIGADDVEIHTGRYSLCKPDQKMEELQRISNFSSEANKAGLKVCAGHGLTYHNVRDICLIKDICELNIGYSIIVRSIFCGLGNAVAEMKTKIVEAEMLCLE